MVDLIAGSIFFVVLTIALILSLTGRIYLGLLFIVPLFPLQNVIERFHQFPFGKDFIDIVLIAMILGWVFRAFANKNKIFEQTPFNKILFVMVVYTYISLWIGSSYLNFSAPLSPGDVRVQTWKNYMLFPLLFFITVNNIKNLKQIKWLVLSMVLAMFIMDRYTGNQINWMPGFLSRSKICGTFVWLGPNEVAAFFATYTFVLLGIFLNDKRKIRRVLFAVAIILNLYCTLFLYSRGAYVAILAGLVFISFLTNKKLILPLILLLIFWQAVLPEQVIERINQTQTEEGTLDYSSQSRFELWERGLNLFKKVPIMGVGFGMIPYMAEIGRGDTHNIYIEILVEQGIIGIIIFLLLLWLCLKNGLELYKTAGNPFLKGLGLGFAACVIATMVTNFFGDRWTYLQLGAYFWVFLGLVVRGNLITQQEKLENNITLAKKSRTI